MSIKAELVRKFLTDQKRTKEWLAVQLDCSMATVERVLAGKPPGLEIALKLAALMGRKVEDLVAHKAG